MDALELARKVGSSLAGEIGAKAFEEMELCYASRLLPRFNDNPTIRSHQNLLFYWDQSYLKSTLINKFCETIPSSLKLLDITRMSVEKLVGSFNDEDGVVVKPSLLGIHFASTTELMTFLGTGEQFRQKVDLMNKVMEGEPVDVQLVKLVQPSLRRTYIGKLAREGLEYDNINGRLRFRPEVSMIAASRPLGNTTYTFLGASGHIGRYHTIQFDITPYHRELLTKSYKLDTDALAELKSLNQDLVTKQIAVLREPPNDMIQPLINGLLDRAKQLDGGDKPLTTIVDMRSKGDLIREFVAHAFLHNPDNLTYTDEDVRFIEERLDHFIEFRSSPIIASDFTKSTENKVMIAEREIVSIIRREGLERSAILKALEKMGISRATTDRAIRNLKDNKKIISKDAKYFQNIAGCLNTTGDYSTIDEDRPKNSDKERSEQG